MAQIVVGRKNQFFLPGEGIDREVLQSDICKYLDHDATSRPGEYNGSTGYFIFAYRNFTSEQINDLKLNSSRIKRERSDRQAAYKAQPNNRKRGRDPPVQVPYVESNTFALSNQRFEEYEQHRIKPEPPSPPRQQPPPHSSFIPPAGPPASIPPRHDSGYPVSPPQGPSMYPLVGRNHEVITPPYTTTPDSNHSQPSTASYDSRGYPKEPYRQDPYVPPYPDKPMQYPGPQQANVGRPYPSQQQVQQKVHRDESYYNRNDNDDDDDAMDTRPEIYGNSRADMRPERMDTRPERMDSRGDREMRGERDVRTDRDTRGERDMRGDRDMRGSRPERDNRGESEMRDSRSMAPPMQMPQPPSRMETRPTPRSEIHPEHRPDHRPESRVGDARDSRQYQDPRYKPYDNRRGPRG